jgi:hypothetical protein
MLIFKKGGMYWKNIIGMNFIIFLKTFHNGKFSEVNKVWVDRFACDQAPSSFDFKSTNMECHIQ